ncbi:MAG TPA: LamG domain-containing protein, partial [Planctomycetes bacterium]|nr:LamG domain-containing protein [Planctomycetota bacterium]
MEHFGIYSPVLGKREDFPSIFLQNAFTADNSNIRLYNGEIHSAKMRVKELAETTVTQGTVTQATGSAALNGTGTAWHAGYNGRAILVNGNSYTISSVTGETSLILNTTPSYLLNNCVAYWKLNETSGTDISDEMGTNDGVSAVDASGMTAAGKIGNCLQFDGANDYIEVADHSSLDFGASTDFSIVMLFKTNDDGNPMWLIHKGTSYITGANFTIRKTAANILTASIGDGTNVVYVSSDSVINDNDWHQVIVSCNRDGNMTMYIDGVSNGSQDISAVGDIDNNEKLYIGCNNSKAQKWNGYIDDTMIFNKAVNATEAAYIYNSGSGRTEFLTGISYQIGTLGKIVATPDSNPVLKYHTHITDTGTEILLAFTKDHIYRWETTGNAWYLMYTCTSSCTYWDVASF